MHYGGNLALMDAVKSFFAKLGPKLVAWWNIALAYTVWKVVFWWKKQTGWLDLGQIITVTGTVIAVDINVTGPANDGDVCFNVQLDPGQERYITGFGGRLTTESDTDPTPSIHCEIVPWMRSKFEGKWQQLAVGKRVRVTGRWGFDGVHTGKPEWLEVLYALVRHMPNVKQGWFEIHEVTDFDFIF